MYARVVTFRGKQGNFKDGIRKLEESMPTLRKNHGFHDLYCLTDQKTGNCLIFALWESEQTLQSASDAINPIRDAVTRAFGSTGEPKIEIYEISRAPSWAMSKAA